MWIWILYCVLGITTGFLAGYFIFYVRYKEAQLIDELRKNFAKNKEDLEKTIEKNKSYEIENKTLREELKKIMTENDDFLRVIAELSIYREHIKQGGEKAKELANILGIYNKEIEERIQKIFGKDIDLTEEGVSIGWNKK